MYILHYRDSINDRCMPPTHKLMCAPLRGEYEMSHCHFVRAKFRNCITFYTVSHRRGAVIKQCTHPFDTGVAMRSYDRNDS